jgi:hypothetical protein
MKSARVSTPHRVGDLLTAAVPALAERMLAGEIQREWVALVGPALGQRSRPSALDRGVLEIRADNSPGLMELEMRGGEILEALARRHGRSVLSLRFVLGTVPPAPAPPTRRRGAALPRLSEEETLEIDRATSALADPVLAGALRRLLTKDRLAQRQRSAVPAAEKDLP